MIAIFIDPPNLFRLDTVNKGGGGGLIVQQNEAFRAGVGIRFMNMNMSRLAVND